MNPISRERLEEIYNRTIENEVFKSPELEGILGTYPLTYTSDVFVTNHNSDVLNWLFQRDSNRDNNNKISNIFYNLRQGTKYINDEKGNLCKTVKKLIELYNPTEDCTDKDRDKCGTCIKEYLQGVFSDTHLCNHAFSFFANQVFEEACNLEKSKDKPLSLVITKDYFEVLTASNFTAELRIDSLGSKEISKSWHSCHSIGDENKFWYGNYFWYNRYNTIMVYLTDNIIKSDNQEEKLISSEFKQNRKIARCWLHLENGKLLFDRVFPSMHSNLLKELLTQVIRTISDLPLIDFYNKQNKNYYLDIDEMGDYFKSKPYLDSYEETETVECHYCGNRVDENDIISYGNNYLCNDCYQDHYFTCDHCEEIFPNDDSSYNNDNYYCSDCFNDLFSECDNCNEVFPNSEISSEGLCSDCYDEKYFICSDCRQTLDKDQESDIENLCNECFSEKELEELEVIEKKEDINTVTLILESE